MHLIGTCTQLVSKKGLPKRSVYVSKSTVWDSKVLPPSSALVNEANTWLELY